MPVVGAQDNIKPTAPDLHQAVVVNSAAPEVTSGAQAGAQPQRLQAQVPQGAGEMPPPPPVTHSSAAPRGNPEARQLLPAGALPPPQPPPSVQAGNSTRVGSMAAAGVAGTAERGHKRAAPGAEPIDIEASAIDLTAGMSPATSAVPTTTHSKRQRSRRRRQADTQAATPTEVADLTMLDSGDVIDSLQGRRRSEAGAVAVHDTTAPRKLASDNGGKRSEVDAAPVSMQRVATASALRPASAPAPSSSMAAKAQQRPSAPLAYKPANGASTSPAQRPLASLHPVFTPPDVLAPAAAGAFATHGLLHFEVSDFAARAAPRQAAFDQLRASVSAVCSSLSCFIVICAA